MLHNASAVRVPQRRTRPSMGDRLREAIAALAGSDARVVAHSESGWASITFTGSRHAFSIVFDGVEGVDRGESFVAALPDHEFTLPRTLVADASITSVEHTMLPEPRLAIGIELLLLDES